MTITPGDIRKAMASAVIDDLLNAQPLLEHRPNDSDGGKTYEVRGYINPAALGAFGAQQLINVLEYRHPGTLARLNGQQPAEITEAELHALLEATGLPGNPCHRDQAAAIAKLIHDRHAYRPSFNDI